MNFALAQAFPNVDLAAVKRKFWDMGNLDYLLHEGQWVIERAFLRSTKKLFVADCSRQLGKSTWASKKCVERALTNPGSRIRYATAFLTDLEQFILPAFDLVLKDCPAYMRPKYNSQKSEFRFPPPYNSTIRLVGLDRKPNGLRGNKLDLVVLDEAGYMARLDYLYRFVIIPAMTHVRDAKIIVPSTQPETPDHEFTSFCDKAEIEGCYVKLDVYKNPLLSNQQIDEIAAELGGKDSTAFRREYLCERIVEEGRALIAEFNESCHVVESPRDKYHPFWHKIESLDSGVRDQTAWLAGYYDWNRAKLCIEDEFAITGHKVTTRNINELVRAKEKERGYENVYRRTADNDNLILIQDLGTEYGLFFTPTNKDSLHAMVNKVKIWFGQGRIEIHPRCVRLISALKAGIWDKNREKFDRSRVHGHFDLIAALVYMVRNVPEHENPVPEGWDVALSDTITIKRRKEESEGAEELRRAFGFTKY